MTRDELVAFICDDASLDPSEINDDTLLFTDGYIDSFTMTSLIAYLEEEFGAEIAQSAVTLENFDTLSRIMNFVSRMDAA